MEPSLERRRGPGRRRTDAEDERRLRGLLHDLGHQMTTLSSCGGTMELRSPGGGGTVVRIVLPPQMSRQLAAAGASRDA